MIFTTNSHLDVSTGNMLPSALEITGIGRVGMGQTIQILDDFGNPRMYTDCGSGEAGECDTPGGPGGVWGDWAGEVIPSLRDIDRGGSAGAAKKADDISGTTLILIGAAIVLFMMMSGGGRR